MSLTTIGIAIIVCAATWLLTGFVLRVGGILLALPPPSVSPRRAMLRR